MDNDLDRSIRLLDESASYSRRKLLRRSFIQNQSNERSLDYSDLGERFYNDSFKSILEDNKTLTGTVVRTNQPWNSTMESLYLEFFEVLQTYSDSADILNVVAEMSRCCSDTLNVVKGLQSKVAVDVTPETWLENERNTWRLIYILYGNRLMHMDNDDQTNDYVGKSEKYCMLSLFKRESLVRESQLVIDWLECNAAQRDDEVLHFSDSTIGWENTLHQLKSKDTIVFGASREIVQHLNPDAPCTEKLPLHDLDMEDEKRLCRKMFTEIRCGKLAEAQMLARNCGHPWRAALLEGWKLHHNPNWEDPYSEEFEDNVDAMEEEGSYHSVEGNGHRDVWKKMAWQYCKMDNLDIYDRAAIAAYCGHIQVLKKVCVNWEDFLWAHMRIMVDVKVESEVREKVVRNYGKLPEEYWDQKMSINDVFNNLESNKSDVVTNEAAKPDRIIQKFIILDEIGKLIEYITDWILEPSVTTQFLRFLTHLMLFLEHVGQINNREVVERVLEEYIKRLSEMKETRLIAFYVSKLNESMQVLIYSSYLEGVIQNEERKAALTYAENCELNIHAIAKQVVENIRGKHVTHDGDLQQKITQFDEYKISSLDWLLFYESQLSECLKQSNALIFMFLTLRKLDAAQLAFNKMPLNILQKLTGEDELNEEMQQHIREYLSYKAYLDAQEAFNVWFKNFKSKPVQPERPADNIPFADKVAYEHRVSQYKAEIGRWKLTIGQLAKLAKSSLYNVLLFPNGWLSGAHDASYLQSTCIPECTLLLYTVLYDSKHFEECVQLADILTNEKFKLYQMYSKEKLGEIFIKLSECSVALVNHKKDPWGNEMTA